MIFISVRFIKFEWHLWNWSMFFGISVQQRYSIVAQLFASMCITVNTFTVSIPKIGKVKKTPKEFRLKKRDKTFRISLWLRNHFLFRGVKTDFCPQSRLRFCGSLPGHVTYLNTFWSLWPQYKMHGVHNSMKMHISMVWTKSQPKSNFF